MENDEKIDEVIGRLLKEANNKDKKKYIGTIVVFGLIYIILFLWINNKIIYTETTNILIEIFIPFAVLPFIFILLSTFQNRIIDNLFEIFVRAKIFKKKYRKDTDFLWVLLRATSVIFYYGLILSVFIWIVFHKSINVKELSKFSGLILVFSTFILVFIYSIVVLPKMISKKIKIEEYKYFYWFHFLKGSLINNPFSILCILLYFMISIFICVYLYFHEMDIHSPLNGNQFGTIISLISLWLTTGLIISQNFLNSYWEIFQTYEKYASHILRERILHGGKFQYDLIGLGNLGKVICGSLLYQNVMQYNIDKNKPLKLFELIVDRNLIIRLIPRDVIVIEKDQMLFEETRVEQESGLIYGFANGKEMVLLDKYVNIKSDDKKVDHLAVFCINGDGGYLPSLNLADYKKNKVIFNTSSDIDMGLKLKLIFENKNINTVETINEFPVVISTVEDSSTDSFLENNNNNDSQNYYPLHANQIEGNSIAVRLFMVIRNIIENNKTSNDGNSDVFIFLLGSSKTLYYILFNLRCYLKLIFKEEEKLKKFYEKNICVITDENLIINECDKKSGLNQYNWNILFDNNITYKIPLVFETPNKFHSINNAYNWVEKKITDKNLVPLFVFSTKQRYDAIRICQHIKQIQHIGKLEYLGIVTSVTDEIICSIEYLLKDYPPLKLFFRKYPGFPAEVNDIILRKSRIISNQIISISNCLRDNDKDIKNKESINRYPGKLVFCLPNESGALARMITDISGLVGFEWSDLKLKYPSFFNNYSYTFRSEKFVDYKMFVFRGDAFLCELRKENTQCTRIVNNYKGYGDDIFIDRLNQHFSYVQSNKMTEYFNTRCPLSQYSNCSSSNNNVPIDKSNLNNSDFATIKILANYDDLPGSFGLALSDILMAGKDLKFNDGVNKNSIAEIAYHNSSLCIDPTKTICRLYVQFKDVNQQPPYRTNTKIDEMFKKRPIMGIKIKPSRVNSDWIQYAENLKTYFLSMNIEFELTDYNNVIILYNSKYKIIENFKSFLEEDF